MFCVFMLVSIISCVSSSCSKKETVLVQQKYEFPDANWNFDHKLVTFKMDVKDISQPCQVILELEHEKIDAIRSLPFTVTIHSPDGGESSRRAAFVFNDPENNKDNKTVSVAYKEHYFNTPGDYTVEVYRKYDRFDLYGMKSLTAKIIKLKKGES